MQRKNAVIKIIPTFFSVKEPQEKGKYRHVNEQGFREIMNE